MKRVGGREGSCDDYRQSTEEVTQMIPFLLAINSHAAARGEGLHTEFTRHYAQLLRMAQMRAETQRFVKAPRPAPRQSS